VNVHLNRIATWQGLAQCWRCHPGKISADTHAENVHNESVTNVARYKRAVCCKQACYERVCYEQDYFERTSSWTW